MIPRPPELRIVPYPVHLPDLPHMQATPQNMQLPRAPDEPPTRTGLLNPLVQPKKQEQITKGHTTSLQVTLGSTSLPQQTPPPGFTGIGLSIKVRVQVDLIPNTQPPSQDPSPSEVTNQPAHVHLAVAQIPKGNTRSKGGNRQRVHGPVRKDGTGTPAAPAIKPLPAQNQPPRIQTQPPTARMETVNTQTIHIQPDGKGGFTATGNDITMVYLQIHHHPLNNTWETTERKTAFKPEWTGNRTASGQRSTILGSTATTGASHPHRRRRSSPATGISPNE